MAQGNWWFDNQNVNNLKGIPDDPVNRIILPDETIIEFLLALPIARRDFQIIVPLMLPEEQTRLNGIVAKNPRCLTDEPDLDAGIQSDRVMAQFNTIGVHDPNRRRR
jgi:hypothetical protein